MSLVARHNFKLLIHLISFIFSKGDYKEKGQFYDN